MHTIEKVWAHKGLPCVVLMFNDMGVRNGYVGLGPDHPLYGHPYNKETPVLTPHVSALEDQPIGDRGIMALLSATLSDEESLTRPDIFFNVHGSITYSAFTTITGYPMQHWTYEKLPTRSQSWICWPTWWYGYDCGHFEDGRDLSVMPKEVRKHFAYFTPYPVRSLEYCMRQCEQLADQLALL